MFCLFKMCQELSKFSLTIFNFYSLPDYHIGRILIALFNDTLQKQFTLIVDLSKIYMNNVLKLL